MNAEQFFNNGFGADVEKVHRRHVIQLMTNFAKHYHQAKLKTNFTPNEAESERLKCVMEDAKPNCDCKLDQCMKKGW